MRRSCIYSLVALLICILSSCKDMDYKKACNEHDWDKAYAILHEMEKDVDKAREAVDKASEKFAEEPKYDVDRDLFGDLRHTPRAAYETAGKKVDAKMEEYSKVAEEYRTAEHYVVCQEGLYLLEQGDKESLMRIAFLVKERNASYLWDELIDVAKSCDDQELYSKLLRMSGKEEQTSPNDIE